MVNLPPEMADTIIHAVSLDLHLPAKIVFFAMSQFAG
jgi:hypothetical protein